MNRIRPHPRTPARVRPENAAPAIELSPAEKRFVDNYCIHFNGTMAAGAIGKERYLASRWLKEEHIRRAINERIELQRARSNVSKDKTSQMLHDVYDAAFAEGQFGVAGKAAMDIAKLHGFIIDRSVALTVNIEDMTEEQLREMVGNRYDPQLVKDITDKIESDRAALPEPKSDPTPAK